MKDAVAAQDEANWQAVIRECKNLLSLDEANEVGLWSYHVLLNASIDRLELAISKLRRA